jgi:hypothetical protein
VTAPERLLLAIDTATTRIVVACGAPDGTLLGGSAWGAGHRHGETLLPAIERVLEPLGGRRAIAAVVVGTGPGAFTGLRVGIATAKGIAHGLGCPLIGVATGRALLAASAGTRDVLLLPGGPTDRVLVTLDGSARLLPGGQEPDLRDGERLVAVDLEGRAPAAALARGEAARDQLGAVLIRIGAERLAAGDVDEVAALVPEYVTLPRGVRATTGEVAWSRDPR